ncbi:galactan beta-1,4-galactosyltransferase GALS1 isoform X2 [Physcomitrium patens]|uniref:Glycosyltransferase family 92 protein n=1 Tax=Physcomitrium patens TaxID=3218 RepID=A0A2K1K5R8_PHYPA|nr:galactan beta-1,4-galactosyltransferase GALS1-like isoform X2 [Physcomitrium patens]PNR49124.1 hypothetical protein PHYPA_011020 [Physcomitrium patens]|eukprot:XP_024382490.1 galactan beta-1,4-galactosyltransferase GALS1-like isoform X2 [Physcomitrella patens]
MARQWLRKSELNEKLWKGDKGESLLDSSVAGVRTALSAESLAKILLLVVVNSVFLLAALHLLNSKREFDNRGDRSNCVTNYRLNNVHPMSLSLDQNRLIQSSEFAPKNESNQENIRQFDTFGVAVHLFIKMSAYRGGSNSFAIIGLEAKNPGELYNDPPYECVWIPGPDSLVWAPLKGSAIKMLPDTGNVYSRLYSAVIINCTFSQDVGVDRKGGQLVLYASYGDQYPRNPERIVALTEQPDEFPGVEFYESSDMKYDYVYCGSPLFGNLSPQKIREWIAYHAHFFGPRSHFFLYDAGGVHDNVRRMIEPWIKAGRVTLDNIREQEKFDGYYHNQFMVVNDCFHRARHLARWIFFFDVDEFIWAPPNDNSLPAILARYENQSQIIIWQKPMSKSLCAQEQGEAGNDSSFSRKWTFEKLVFKSIKWRESHDCKYAIQGQKAMGTGIHRSGHLIGGNATTYADPLNYYHYHNTINKRDEVCEDFIDKSVVYVNPRNRTDIYTHDDGLAVLADHIKEFERDVIGPQSFIL